ncbi:thiazole tautomerase TenI [Fictibacillus nanhaiensis]|nr:thiazole tautomerase TenI [Fictibacillus nanhaiensis]
MRKQLHVVSTGKQPDRVLINIMREIHPYISALHVREKSKTAKELVCLMEQLTKAGVPLRKLIVNDRVDVAICSGTRGVQLAHHSLDLSLVKTAFPDLTIGCSIHSVTEAIDSEQHGASYLLYGHVFSTSSKRGIEPKGLEKLNDVTSQTTLPVIAIGGIQPANVCDVMRAGASGIAVMSGILEAQSPLQSVIEYRNHLEVWDEAYI